IAMLAALLLPAVNSAREAGRKATCNNNQRNFGLAVQQFESKKGYFPPYRQTQAWGAPTASGTTLNIVMLTWRVLIMPEMGKDPIYQAIKTAAPIATSSSTLPAMPYWEEAVCPSDGDVTDRAHPWTTYVCNTGMIDNPGSAS